MVVGKNITVGTDDETGTETVLLLFPPRYVPKKTAKKVIIAKGNPPAGQTLRLHNLGCTDVYDRGA